MKSLKTPMEPRRLTGMPACEGARKWVGYSDGYDCPTVIYERAIGAAERFANSGVRAL